MESNDKDALKKMNETNQGWKPGVKRSYSRMTITPIAVETENSILAESVGNNSMIISVGQELGPTYDFSSDFDSNAGKTFSHEWEGSL